MVSRMRLTDKQYYWTGDWLTPNRVERPWFISYERYHIKPTIQLPEYDTSLLELFEDSFVTNATQTAYIADDQTLSYRALDELSRQVAAYLQQSGLQVGDAVGVMLPNILHYPVIALGVVRAGMVLVSINSSYTSRELEYQLQDANVKILFMLDRFYPTFTKINAEALSSLSAIVLCRMSDLASKIVRIAARLWHPKLPNDSSRTSLYFSQLLQYTKAQAYQRPCLTLEHTAVLQYTGGTTGVAKGAVLSHGNIIANLKQIDNLLRSAYSEDSQDDILLAALPLYHVFSFTICCVLVPYRGFTGLLIANPREVVKLIAMLRQYPPSFILGVNTLFSVLVQHPTFKRLDFSYLKATIGGGMAILPSLAKRWHKITGLPIIEGYGLSETSPVIAFNPLTIAEFTNKVGIPAPATDIVLFDDDGHPVPIGERGEIAVKGPQVMKGYQNRPEDTANAFTQDGYLRTGDIGIMDDRGFIKIVDRKKDMMVVSGFNVYPNEIEEVMQTHEDVAECVAIGIPSPTRGEEPKIFVVRRYNKVTADALIEFGRQHLIGYKRPRHVEFVDSLPKSSVGKVLRKELRKREGLA